jgi:hypothetical protein
MKYITVAIVNFLISLIIFTIFSNNFIQIFISSGGLFYDYMSIYQIIYLILFFASIYIIFSSVKLFSLYLKNKNNTNGKNTDLNKYFYINLRFIISIIILTVFWFYLLINSF